MRQLELVIGIFGFFCVVCGIVSALEKAVGIGLLLIRTFKLRNFFPCLCDSSTLTASTEICNSMLNAKTVVLRIGRAKGKVNNGHISEALTPEHSGYSKLRQLLIASSKTTTSTYYDDIADALLRESPPGIYRLSTYEEWIADQETKALIAPSELKLFVWSCCEQSSRALWLGFSGIFGLVVLIVSLVGYLK